MTAGSACDTCSTDEEFSQCSDLLNAACCTDVDCTNGVPTSCSDACAEAIMPTKNQCNTFLSNSGWQMQAVLLAFDAVNALCEATHGGH